MFQNPEFPIEHSLPEHVLYQITHRIYFQKKINHPICRRL
ncbi:hypothetical protein LEP1GSC125_1043 [Leptospira mayottensis 200901122]|uniref:Uncharacterized protein n=1 Tax=Leptospira mayottensis 200901122 TaxID=1193010 RepID=A0AA87MJV1_9LEPT|nr:hypothetical protein LEP1GSC125_1043 [Leptospira mayottensis 200901122]